MANADQFTRVLRAQELSEDRLLDLPAVIGVASGPRVRRGKQTRELCVQVFVERKQPLEALGAAERVPETVTAESDSIGTDVIEITRPHEHQDTTRYRPVPGGCSIGRSRASRPARSAAGRSTTATTPSSCSPTTT